MSYVPFSWIRTGSLPQNKAPQTKTEAMQGGAGNKAKVHAWLVGLIESGCAPWNRDGKSRTAVAVGWFPKELWTPYELLDIEDIAGECPY